MCEFFGCQSDVFCMCYHFEDVASMKHETRQLIKKHNRDTISAKESLFLTFSLTQDLSVVAIALLRV